MKDSIEKYLSTNQKKRIEAEKKRIEAEKKRTECEKKVAVPVEQPQQPNERATIVVQGTICGQGVSE